MALCYHPTTATATALLYRASGSKLPSFCLCHLLLRAGFSDGAAASGLQHPSLYPQRMTISSTSILPAHSSSIPSTHFYAGTRLLWHFPAPFSIFGWRLALPAVLLPGACIFLLTHFICKVGQQAHRQDRTDRHDHRPGSATPRVSPQRLLPTITTPTPNPSPPPTPHPTMPSRAAH